MQIDFEGEVHHWHSNPKFFLVSLPLEESLEIAQMYEGLTNGFGSLKVEVRVGATVWRTSIFPDTATKCFELPLKAEVRKKYNLVNGSMVNIGLEILS